MSRLRIPYLMAITLQLWMLLPLSHAGDSLILQSTTSTQNSGLYDYILPIYEAETGIRVHVVAVGTGQAIKNAANGDGDVLLVHSKPAEEEFVKQGYGVERFDVMYNDFVIIGPADDPAEIASVESVSEALARIFNQGQLFASRGDDSGTHKKELSLWQLAGVDPTPHSGQWYRETGSGMGATLNLAAGMGAYTLSDRATWIKFANKADLALLYEGDESLLNQYGIIMVNPDRYPNINRKGAQSFIDWILGKSGQDAIAAHTVNGKQLFFPNAAR